MKTALKLIETIEDELFGIDEEHLTPAEQNIKRHIEKFKEEKK